MIAAARDALVRHFCTGLPEPQFFSIAELLARWRGDRVTLRQLCDWIEHQNFVLGARVRDTGDIAEKTTRADGTKVIRKTTRWVLAGPVKREPLETLYFDSDTLLKILTAPDGVQVGAPATYSKVDRAPSCGTCHLYGGRLLFFSKEHLVAPLAEVQRIETLFRFGKKAPAGVRAYRWLRSAALGGLMTSLLKLFGKDIPSKSEF